MKRPRAGLAGALVLTLGMWAVAAEPPATASEREQIRRERAEVEARFKAGKAACQERFVVTSCIDELQVQRREALAGLRQRELELDEAKRKAEAQDYERRLAAKRAAAASKPAPEPRQEPAPRAVSKAASAASAPGTRAQRRSKTADDPHEAAARVAARQRREAEAAAHREAVEKRNADRAASGKKSTPLPIPAPLPPASAAAD